MVRPSKKLIFSSSTVRIAYTAQHSRACPSRFPSNDTLTHCAPYLVQVLVERLQVGALCVLWGQVLRLADGVSRPGLTQQDSDD